MFLEAVKVCVGPRLVSQSHERKMPENLLAKANLPGTELGQVTPTTNIEQRHMADR